MYTMIVYHVSLTSLHWHLKQERRPLLLYGATLTAYCRALETIASKLTNLDLHHRVATLNPAGGLMHYANGAYHDATNPSLCAIPFMDAWKTIQLTDASDTVRSVSRRKHQVGVY